MGREAAAEYRRFVDLIGQAPQGLWLRGRAEALEGKRAEALATIADLKAMAARRYVSPSYNAAIFIHLGEKDQAFEWLARACDDRSYDIVFLSVDPLYDGLRSDPRFADLLRKAGFAPRAR